MRLIDNQEGYLFELPPENVVLLAPRPRGEAPVLSPLKLLPVRSLTVHSSDGSSAQWEETASGWRKRPA